ncbi:hypothetical protein [Mariniblastus fucicola]|uniref:Uncharacterized protein n=1 Tax=Mariniblastus fucicola TaxID=980251 RepID=A0A5B9PR97_9BACT|nr:hypothetical protein [Mariniblastus fucicola]QEG25021.1 hypothetical protein MFFC18_49440 [Mariniblastus fucicola]
MSDPANNRVNDLLSAWHDGPANATEFGDKRLLDEASQSVADSLLVHGLLMDAGRREADRAEDRVGSVMSHIDSGFASEASHPILANTRQPRRRQFAILTWSVAIATVVMLMFVFSSPDQSVSSAMESLEKIVEAASKKIDRTYSVRLVEEYARGQRPGNLPADLRSRKAKDQIDGATLYVRGANQYVMTTMLDSGEKRTIGCDGSQSWAMRENGPVHVSSDIERFRGGLPGGQQDIPFLNLQNHLSQLQTGYEIEMGKQQETVAGVVLSQLIGARKSRDVRGPKQIEIWFDSSTGTVHQMLLDGLPRGRGGPKSVMLELTDLSRLPDGFFSHTSHHEPGRRIKSD